MMFWTARNPTTTVPKKENILVLPYLGIQSKIVTKQLKTCITKFYDCSNLRPLFSKALSASSLYFRTNIDNIGSTVPNCQKLCIRLVVGTARISILEKKTYIAWQKNWTFKNNHKQLLCSCFFRLLTTSSQLMVTKLKMEPLWFTAIIT